MGLKRGSQRTGDKCIGSFVGFKIASNFLRRSGF